MDMENHEGQFEVAIFGAGCFWGVEEVFRTTDGVISTEVGFSGGHTESPTYKQVCMDTTGHAEVVRVVFDPAQVDYEALLNVFWENHDPTQLNRQGPDVGAQYRSVIFYTVDGQKVVAEKSKMARNASGKHRRPIVTSIEPAKPFFAAEDYHQQYLLKRGLSSCHL